MTLQELRKQLKEEFLINEIESPEADSGLLLMHALHLSKTELLLQNHTLADEDVAAVLQLASRRIKGEPVRYILGVCPFMDLEFAVNPATLIPRPETELLVEAVSERISGNSPLSLWDIGCGSGCIGITLAHRHPNLSVTELDISQRALDTAQTTAERYELSARIDFIKHDILTGMPNLSPPDIIVSNPPYIPTKDLAGLQKEVHLFEPQTALDGGEDGLMFYRSIIANAPLPPGGLLAFEIGYDQGESVPRLMEESGYKDVTLLHDLAGHPRVVFGFHE
ncbi:MAG: peptide chain release factor N(5)-glutamine methyltransferase [Clostridia bacterium]|nr:peptide chain release factor N(5)-glutamine methyltransferase [Clostridia bacterium]